VAVDPVVGKPKTVWPELWRAGAAHQHHQLAADLRDHQRQNLGLDYELANSLPTTSA
jgi:hypothetical protein